MEYLYGNLIGQYIETKETRNNPMFCISGYVEDVIHGVKSDYIVLSNTNDNIQVRIIDVHDIKYVNCKCGYLPCGEPVKVEHLSNGKFFVDGELNEEVYNED